MLYAHRNELTWKQVSDKEKYVLYSYQLFNELKANWKAGNHQKPVYLW